MPVIDAHVHLYPPEANPDPAAWAAARGETLWATLCTRRRRDGRPVQGFPDVGALLRELDACGIDRAVLLGWYWQHPATCAEQNRFYAACVQAHPDRLAACATVHPAAGAGALAEIRRARDEGLVGLGELSPHAQGFRPDDPGWRSILALAGDLHLPVTLHVTDPASRSFPGRVDTPLPDFLSWADAFPGTTFILAHWGGGLAWAPEALARPNVLFDTAASPLLYGPEVWAKAPAGRVLFGSDHPLHLYPREESGLGLVRLLREARAGGAPADLFGANAARLPGWA